MTIYLPGFGLAAIVSLHMFREYNRIHKAKREERREYVNERRQELLDNVIKSKKRKSDPPKE